MSRSVSRRDLLAGLPVALIAPCLAALPSPKRRGPMPVLQHQGHASTAVTLRHLRADLASQRRRGRHAVHVGRLPEGYTPDSAAAVPPHLTDLHEVVTGCTFTRAMEIAATFNQGQLGVGIADRLWAVAVACPRIVPTAQPGDVSLDCTDGLVLPDDGWVEGGEA